MKCEFQLKNQSFARSLEDSYFLSPLLTIQYLKQLKPNFLNQNTKLFFVIINY